jgi:hypothetical protein
MREQDGAGKEVSGRLHVEQMAVRQASPIGDLVLGADVCHGETEGERRFDLAGRGRQVDDGEDVLDWGRLGSRPSERRSCEARFEDAASEASTDGSPF